MKIMNLGGKWMNLGTLVINAAPAELTNFSRPRV